MIKRLTGYKGVLCTMPWLILILTMTCQKFVISTNSQKNEAKSQKFNILHIIIDDLRPQLGCYEGEFFPAPDHPKMVTPNLDALAKKSALFRQAYVQYALCTPSRTSFLTGRRPETTQVMSHLQYFRDSPGINFTTMPQFFRENGYATIGMGKVFHPHKDESQYSWDKFYEGTGSLQKWQKVGDAYLSVKDAENEPIPLPDDDVKNHAKEALQQISHGLEEGKSNFYMAVGFYKPHLPWVYPEEHLTHYPQSSIKLPRNRWTSQNLPEIAWHEYKALKRKASRDAASRIQATYNTTVPDDLTLLYRARYYACVTYIDSLVGEVLKELEEQDLHQNTVVLVHGDHGYALGENAEWTKQTQFEIAIRVPFMIHVPGQTDEGFVIDELVELVDIFPTLADLTGFSAQQVPRCPSQDSQQQDACHEGTSLTPLFSKSRKPLKDSIFSSNRVHHPELKNVIGKTILTRNFRYTLWVKMGPPVEPLWDEVIAEELYDHRGDREETVNVAGQEDYTAIQDDLKRRLKDGWRKALIE